MSELNATVEQCTEEDSVSAVSEVVSNFIEMIEQFNLESSAKLAGIASNKSLVKAAESIIDDMEGNDSALAENLYYLFDYSEFDTRTVQELIEASEYQSQFGINATAITKILSDPQTGLLAVNAMIEPCKLVITPEKDEKLAGGHNRLAALALLLVRCAGCDWDSFLSQEVPVIVFKVAPRLSPQERALASTILWFSDNGSRSVTSSEKSSYKLTKTNVNLSDATSILDNDAISERDRVSLYALYCAKKEGLLEDKFGHVSRKIRFQEGAEESSTAIIKTETLRGIISSFLTQVTRLKDGTDKKAKPIWKADFANKTTMAKHIRSIFAIDERVGLSLLDVAVMETVKELRSSGVDTATNIAYNKSAHGAKLAELFNANFEPEAVSVQGKTKKVAVLGRRR